MPELPSPIGAWYERQAENARRLAAELRAAREAGRETKDLERRLKEARFVGD